MAELADATQVPLAERMEAARHVIATSAWLDADGRKAILALALWPADSGLPVVAFAEATTEATTAPHGRCEWQACGRPLPEPPRADGKRRRFCSRLCAAQARQDAKRPQPRECHGCGTVFTPAQSDGRYCTRRCYLRAYDRARAGRQREAHAATR